MSSTGLSVAPSALHVKKSQCPNEHSRAASIPHSDPTGKNNASRLRKTFLGTKEESHG